MIAGRYLIRQVIRWFATMRAFLSHHTIAFTGVLVLCLSPAQAQNDFSSRRFPPCPSPSRVHVGQGASAEFLIARDGKTIARLPGQASGGFDEYGMLLVKTAKESHFVNEQGKILAGPYGDALPFSGGFAAVFINGKWGFIDRLGQIAIEPQFRYAFSFQEGFALIRVQDGSWAYIDAQGRQHLRNVVAHPFHEGLTVSFDDATGKYGYLGIDGKWAIPPRFERADDFSEGFAPVQSGGKWGYIWHTGEFAIEPGFDSAGRFHNGIAPVGIGDSYGFVGQRGELVVPAKFEAVNWFCSGLAPVRQGKLWGYIDINGEFVISPRFVSADHFSGDRARVFVKSGTHAQQALIDRTGAVVWKSPARVPIMHSH
jgi:hypothetical protein